jgi:hypothetical protein
VLSKSATALVQALERDHLIGSLQIDRRAGALSHSTRHDECAGDEGDREHDAHDRPKRIVVESAISARDLFRGEDLQPGSSPKLRGPAVALDVFTRTKLVAFGVPIRLPAVAQETNRYPPFPIARESGVRPTIRSGVPRRSKRSPTP